MFDKLICAISIICLAVVLVLVLKDSLRTYFKSLSLGVRSLSLEGQVQEVLVLGGHVLVLWCQVLVLVLGGQVLVNIPVCSTSCSKLAFIAMVELVVSPSRFLQRALYKFSK